MAITSHMATPPLDAHTMYAGTLQRLRNRAIVARESMELWSIVRKLRSKRKRNSPCCGHALLDSASWRRDLHPTTALPFAI